MRNTLLPIDRLNNLTTQIATKNSEEILDETLELLIDCYIAGIKAGASDLNIDFKPNIQDMYDSVFRETKEKTFEDRIKESLDINRVIETEAHRVYVEGILAVAERNNVKKTWVTMLDEKVRDNHTLLEGVTVGASERFYIGEDSALAPGGFDKAENNVNCRCEIVLKE